MKYIISDTSKFEQINLEENKQLNFVLKSGKKVVDLIKRVEVQKFMSQLLTAAQNFVLFCQLLEHLLLS